MTWRNYADVFELCLTSLRGEWKVDPPGFDTLPSEVLDQAVSAWCMVLTRDLRQDFQPPAEVKPWILARLISVTALCRQLAKQGDTNVPPLDEKTLRQLLIAEWHSELRDRWVLLMDLPEEFS